MDTYESEDSQDTDIEPAGRATESGGYDVEPRTAAPLRLGWLYAAGGACLVAAVGVYALPKLVPGQGWIARSIAQHGAPAAVLGFAGLGCIVLARTVRALGAALPPPAPLPRDHGPAIEELSTELAQARGSLQDLRVELVYLKDSITRLVEVRSASDDGAKIAQDSMFRLAASIDQLGGQITRRLEQNEWTLGERIREFEGRIADLASTIAVMSAYARDAAAPVHDAQQALVHAGDLEVPAGYEPSAEDLHVEVDLAPEGFGDLGVLDEIEDDVGYASRQPIGRNGHVDRSSESPRGPLPRASSEHDALRALEFEKQLEIARALLSDPRILASLNASSSGH